MDSLALDAGNGAALTVDEQAQLAAHEQTIERGLKAFYDMGVALRDIRDRRLYRQQYRTFEEYCKQRWDLRRRRAIQIVDAAKVVENVYNCTHLPANESQARELVPLAPHEQRLVWEVVTNTAPDGKVTAKHVKSIVTILQDINTSGAIDDGTGDMIPIELASLLHLKAAVTEETYERMQRQEGYIRDKNGLHFLSTTPEWYTPKPIIERVQAVLGTIDLDPCSSPIANGVVGASRFFNDYGLEQSWQADTVYMNPPYGDVIKQWVDKLVTEYAAGNIEQAIALVPARTDTEWFARLRAYPRCFVRGRLKFWSTEGGENSAPFPSAAVYLGKDSERFYQVFSELGDVYALMHDDNLRLQAKAA